MNPVFTIGYERTDFDRFAAALEAARVDLLADVRMVPFSHKTGFIGAALRDRLAERGIGYAHIRDLGNPKEGRDAAKSGDADTFRRIYRAQMSTSAARRALADIARQAEGRRVCLMCFERDHRNCHRGIVAEALEADGLAVVHLEPEEKVSRLLRRPLSGQADLFAETAGLSPGNPGHGGESG